MFRKVINWGGYQWQVRKCQFVPMKFPIQCYTARVVSEPYTLFQHTRKWKKTTIIIRTAVRENLITRHHAGPIKGTPETPRTSQSTMVFMGFRGTLIMPGDGVSCTGDVSFPSLDPIHILYSNIGWCARVNIMYAYYSPEIRCWQWKF